MAVDTYALTTLSDLKANMGISVSTWDTVLENMIDAASARVESYIGRRIKSRTYVEFVNPQGSRVAVLRQHPIVSIDYVGAGVRHVLTISTDNDASVILATAQWKGASPGAATTVGTLTLVTATTSGSPTTTTNATLRSTDAIAALTVTGFSFSLVESVRADHLHQFGPHDVTSSPLYVTAPAIADIPHRVDYDRGMLYRTDSGMDWEDDWADLRAQGWEPSFGHSRQSLVVQYTAGYSTVPYDVQQATEELAKAMFHARNRDESRNSESLGDYSYTSGGTGVFTEILEERLGSWKEIR